MGFFHLIKYLMFVVYTDVICCCSTYVESFEINDQTSMSVSRPIPWPTQVKCDMKIENWELELKRHGLINKYGFLLDGF